MCAIIGILDRRDGADKDLLRVLCRSMSQRGPDGFGEYFEDCVAMGMCRLAVIDLAQGWQPLTSRAGDVIVFQNGEIYNFRSLRQELWQFGFKFKTDSDTEVIAHGYAHWGIEGLLERLDGMFAIAILDRNLNQLHLARDRFGEKPLFYCHSQGRFAYASNLLPLAALSWVDTSIDLVALDRYLALHYVPGERTILKGIRRVLPGERISVSTTNLRFYRSKYYRLPLRKNLSSNEKQIEADLNAAVSSRLVADVPIGIFLSGGIDSSLVAAMAARISPGISTFSMGFSSEEHDESDHAVAVAKHIGSQHHKFVFDGNSFDALFPEVMNALDEPIGDQATLPVYWLSREARRYVTVVLSGEGADEVFGGYDYYKPFLDQNDNSGLKSEKPLCSFVSNPLNITPSGYPLLTTKEQRVRVMEQSILVCDSWEAEWMNRLGEASSTVQRAGAADLYTWLPDNLLVKLDRMTMAHSLEGRAPYLSPLIAESGINLAVADRVDQGTTKIALRRIAQRWLPREIAERPKQGFVLPMASWLKKWLRDRGGAYDYFAGNPFPGVHMRNLADLVVKDFDERRAFSFIVLVEWHKAFISRVKNLATKFP
jgi:asparagine synthase (glutamine-hydrolysing)